MAELELPPEMFGAENPCFGCSPTHPIGLHLRCSRSESGKEVLTRFVPTDRYQGPPGIMHGGLVMTVADELAVWTLVGLRERFGFTAAVECRLKKPVRTGIELRGRGSILRESARLIRVDVRLEQAGVEVFQGEFAIAMLNAAAAEQLLGMPLPDAWKQFAR